MPGADQSGGHPAVRVQVCRVSANSFQTKRAFPQSGLAHGDPERAFGPAAGGDPLAGIEA
jgi:hypothetical protein